VFHGRCTDDGGKQTVDPGTVGAIVAALVARSADDTADKMVDQAGAALGRLVGWLRRRFTDNGDKAGADALALVEEVPDSPSRVAILAKLLDQRVDRDKDFGAELDRLVAEVRSAGVTIGSIDQRATGDGNVLIAGVVGSTVRVTPPL